MADVTVWDILTAAGATGSFAVLCLLAARIWSGLPNFMDRWLALRAAKAAERVGDWTRRTEEIERLHLRLADCEKMRVEWMHRAITAEATLQGYGDAHQRAQEMLSAERLENNHKPKGEPDG